MASPATDFPSEIIGEVIQHLYKASPSLKEFIPYTRVSPTWHDLGFPLLFRDIKLWASRRRDTRAQSRMDAFFALVETHPQIPHYIRTLDITSNFIMNTDLFFRLANILPKLDFMRLDASALMPLSNQHWWPPIPLWENLGAEGKETLRQLLQSARSLTIIGGTVPFAVYGYSPNLTTLDLRRSGEEVDHFLEAILDLHDHTNRSDYAPIRRLRLGGDTMQALVEHHPGFFAHVEDVELNVHSDQAEKAEYMFAALSKSIKSALIHLHSQPDEEDGIPRQLLDLSGFTGQNLSLGINTSPLHNPNSTDFYRMTLSTLPLSTLINLSLDVFVGATCPDISDARAAIADLLEYLDDAFRLHQVEQPAPAHGGPTIALQRLAIKFRGVCNTDSEPRGCAFWDDHMDLEDLLGAGEGGEAPAPAIAQAMQSASVEVTISTYPHGERTLRLSGPL